MTISILFLLVGCVLGYVVSLLFAARKAAQTNLEAERTRMEMQLLLQQKQDDEQRIRQLQSEKESIQASVIEATQESIRCKTALENEVTRRAEASERLANLQNEHESTRRELTTTLAELAQQKTALHKEQEQSAKESARLAKLQEEYESARRELTTALAELAEQKTALKKEQEHREALAEKMKEMQEKHFAQFRNLAGEIMEQNAGKLKDTNKESMDALLKPLRMQLDSLGQAVKSTNETAAGNKASLEAAIKAMMEKTESLGKDAENLALALRGNTKKQGDWGELILERMLEESGLRKGEEYYLQENHKTDDGKDVRPDVVIRFPDKRCVIVDSKVSLTAYAQYTAAQTEEERRMHIAAHVNSVRKHIDELASKNYPDTVKGTISYVLMFMPNEASYMAAVQEDPTLQLEAYRKKVVLISPTNLLMSLQLAHNLWQKERQTQNVEAIFSRATKLYDKLASVQESLERVGKGIDQAHLAYTQAFNQLFRGRGNYAKQLDDLRQMGISPNKRLNLEDSDDTQE